MSESDTETLYEGETPLIPKPKLGKRGLEWMNKLLHALEFRIKVVKLKARGWTEDEIADEVPEYYYDEEYHGLTSSGMRRVKSTSDLMGAVGTSKGYAGWEWCGERSKEAPELGLPVNACIRSVS